LPVSTFESHRWCRSIDIREALANALALTQDPLETYLSASDLGRRMLNQVFFSEIRVGEDRTVASATLQGPYEQIIARRLIRRGQRASEPGGRQQAANASNPDPFFLGPGV
jgi:hypothetical protein